MLITTDALVIKEMNIGENDRLVTLMTRDFGILKAFASGAKSIKSRRGSATGLLSYSSFSIKKKGDAYRITEAVAHRVFFGAGSDIECLSLAQYFCELCFVLGPREGDAREFLRLILNSLHFLTEKKRPALLVKAITELRVAVISGYMPNLIACDGCGKFEDDIMYFRLTDGQLLCENCRSGEYCMNLTSSVLSVMRHITYSPIERLYSFTMPEKSINQLSAVTEKYIQMQTEHNFSTLEFYYSII